MKPTYRKSQERGESSDVVRFDLVPLLQGQMRTAKFKSAYNSLIFDPRGLQCETYFQGWKSFDVVRYDLGPLLQGQMRIGKFKSAYNSLLFILEVCNLKPTYRKSRAGNLLMWSDLTLGPSFKVKRWFSGFCELSFWWIYCQTTAKLKSAYNLLISGSRGLQCETNLRKSWAGNRLVCSDLTLCPSFKVKRG